MKNTLYAFLTACFLFSGIQAIAQDEAGTKPLHDPSVSFTYVFQSGSQYLLQFSVGIPKDESVLPLKGTEVRFYCGPDKSVSLGSAISNIKGIAECKVPVGFAIPRDEDGFATFYAEYPGCDTVNAITEELRARDMFIEMSYDEEDSIKGIHVFGYCLDASKNKLPLADQTINLYVSRTFSNLKIAELKLDSLGMGSATFPANLPGDSLGNVTILARLEDHSDFLTVESAVVKPWGITSNKQYLLEKRALWTEVAPVWMITTLTILLIGVWGHYAFVVYSLFKIKKMKD